ncbi:MAG TPA: hypothetical protein VFF13_00030 [archaeon]|nr:hypothetical protein [archaeon]
MLRKFVTRLGLRIASANPLRRRPRLSAESIHEEARAEVDSVMRIVRETLGKNSIVHAGFSDKIARKRKNDIEKAYFMYIEIPRDHKDVNERAILETLAKKLNLRKKNSGLGNVHDYFLSGKQKGHVDEIRVSGRQNIDGKIIWELSLFFGKNLTGKHSETDLAVILLAEKYSFGKLPQHKPRQWAPPKLLRPRTEKHE